MSKVTLKDLLEAGAHFGHQVRRWNPAMKPYIFDQREGVHILDLAKTKKGLEEGAAFAKATTAEGGVVLFVGTKRQASAMVKEAAVKAGMPYMTVRWVGGMLTNWAEISKRIKKLLEMREKREKGEYKKYTKREQLEIDRDIAKLEKFLGGVDTMKNLPQALFVVDTHHEAVAVAEANKVGIPVIGMVDTNADPSQVKYVIPINDDAVKSIELVVGAIADAVESAKIKDQKSKK